MVSGPPPPFRTCGVLNLANHVDLTFQAARSCSLIKPPRTGLRSIRS